MGFLSEEPKKFGSLREEFVHDLMKRIEEEKYKNWKGWNDPEKYFDEKKKGKPMGYSLLN